MTCVSVIPMFSPNVRLGGVPDDFVRRFGDVYSAITHDQTPPETSECDQFAGWVLMPFSFVPGLSAYRRHPNPVVFEENCIRLRIGYCRAQCIFCNSLSNACW
jgi:hypothetical protein